MARKPKHPHSNKRKRLAITAQGSTPSSNVLGCPVAADAFRAARLFHQRSDSFRFSESYAYGCVGVADFITGPIRNAGKSRKALKRVSDFAELFYKFATDRPDPYPFHCKAALLPIVFRLQSLWRRGATIPRFGRYSSEVFIECLGALLPLEQPASRDAASSNRGRQVRTDPQVGTEFISPIERASEDRNAKIGHLLYCALFTLLAL